MSRVRGKNTGIEMLVFRELRKRGISFRKHYKKVSGSPDVAFPKRKIAVFVDGDFWHGYRYPAWKGKIKRKFWRDKIERNRARDRRTFAKLRREGWRVLRVWEHELERDETEALGRVVAFVKRKG